VIDIRQGPTFSGWTPYPGAILFAVGILLAVFAINEDITGLIVALPLTFFGLVIFLNLQGTMIDPERKRCRMYRSFVLFRIGLWLDTGRFDRVVVSHEREQFSHAFGRDMGRTAHIRSYFVTLRGNDIHLHLNECDKRKDAMALAERVSLALALPVDDRAQLPKPRADRRR
jgi:hypothetical protein